MKKVIKKIVNVRLLSAIALATTLAACSSTDDEDEAIKIAELTDINEQFEVDVAWEKGIGDGVDDYFSRIKPAYGYNKVFSISREGDAYAIDANSGDKVWHIDLSDVNKERGFFDSREPALLAGGPVTGVNKVFIGSENGQIFALDAETGELAWQGKVKGEVIARPALDSGILVVNTASGVLKAFNANTGEDLWQVDLDVPPLTLRGISAPTAAAGGVLVGTSAGELSVFMLEKGQQGWTVPVGEATGSTELERVIDVDSQPLVFGDKVYAISSRGNLVAIDIRNGRILWKRQYSSYRQLAIKGNTLFLTNLKGHVYAVDRVNGLERWSNLALTNRSVTGPVVIGDYLAVGDFEGYLHFLDQETGEFVARHKVDSSGIYATPTVAEGTIYVQARDGSLQAVKLP
ncbi:outer membrane protein assembly factor BamB [Thalassotalea montiporae]